MILGRDKLKLHDPVCLFDLSDDLDLEIELCGNREVRQIETAEMVLGNVVYALREYARESGAEIPKALDSIDIDDFR